MKRHFDLTDKLMEQFQDREPVPKRISVTQVYPLLNDWQDRPIDLQSAVRMWEGEAKHRMVQGLMPEYKQEVKKEYDIGDGYTLVGKADLLAEDHALEIKTSREVLDKAKDWHAMQARLYATMFEIPFVYIVQPVFNGDKFWLKVLRKCARNDVWFEKITNELKQKYELNRGY